MTNNVIDLKIHEAKDKAKFSKVKKEISANLAQNLLITAGECALLHKILKQEDCSLSEIIAVRTLHIMTSTLFDDVRAMRERRINGKKTSGKT